jgi:hypothetical protein
VVDAHGIPLAVLVSAANVHDSKMMLATVDAIEPIRAKTRGRPRRRPHKLHADTGYDYRYEHRADVHLAFLQLGCALISLRFLG